MSEFYAVVQSIGATEDSTRVRVAARGVRRHGEHESFGEFYIWDVDAGAVELGQQVEVHQTGAYFYPVDVKHYNFDRTR